MTSNLSRDPGVSSPLARWLPWLTAVLLFGFYIAHNRGFAVDDSYITFRYAQNALEGHGLVFNVGQHYYGSTATGYAVLLLALVKLLALFHILVDIHQVSTALSAFAIVSVAGLAAHLVMRTGSPLRLLAGVAVAIFIAVLPLSSVVAAHETYFYVALLLWASFLAIFQRRTHWAVLLLVLAHAVRPDSLLFALVLLAALLVAAVLAPAQAPVSKRQSIVMGALFSLGAFAWLLAMKLYYGTFFPGTMDAKKAQIVLGDWLRFEPSSVIPMLDGQFSGRYWILLPVLSLSAAAWHLRGARDQGRWQVTVTPWGLFSGVWLVFGIGLASAYYVFTVTIWPWYVAPIGVALVLSAVAAASGLGAGRVPAPQASQYPGRAARTAWSVASLVLLVGSAMAMKPDVSHQARHFFDGRNINGHLHSYDAVVIYLREHEPNGTSVAISEPGTFGYRLGPKYLVLDTLGLASPGVAKALLGGDRDYVLRTWSPKYYVASWNGTYNLERRPGFMQDYELVAEFGHPYWDVNLKGGIRLYRRHDTAGKP